MQFEQVTTPLQVRPNDLDSLGHVNNAVVLEYLEAGRWAWMAHHHLRRGSSIVPVVSRIEVNYVQEIPYQELYIKTSTDMLPFEDLEDSLTYRVFFQQQIVIRDGDVVAVDARVQVAFIDSEERRLRTLQDFLALNVSSII